MSMTVKYLNTSVPTLYCGTCGTVPHTNGSRCPLCRTRNVYANRNEYVRAEGHKIAQRQKRRKLLNFIRRNLLVLYVYIYKGLAACCVVGAPYLTLLADRYAFTQRGYYGVGGEFLVPIYILTAGIIVFATGRKTERYFGYSTFRAKMHDLRRCSDED